MYPIHRQLFERGLRSLRIVQTDKALSRLLTNSSWLLGSNVIGIALGLIQGILIARILGVENYGVLGVVMAFVTVVNRLTSFRMNEFVIKYVNDAIAAHELSQACAFVKASLVVESGASILAFVLTVALAPAGAQWFVHSPDAQQLIVAYAVVILGNMASESSLGVLYVFGRFKSQSLLSIVSKACGLVVVISVFLVGGGIGGILASYLVSSLTYSIPLQILAFHEAQLRLGSRWWMTPFARFPNWRPAWGFILSTNVGATLSLITRDSDLLWLGFFRSPTEVGYYKLAWSLAGLIFMPIQALTSGAYPEISRKTATSDWPNFSALLRRLSILSAVYVIPVSLIAMFFSSWLIGLLYGTEYVPASLALNILLVGMSIANILFWGRPALLALGLPQVSLAINAVVTALKVIGSLILLPIYGYVGNAFLMSLLNTIASLAHTIKVRIEIKRHLSELN